jgi:hypothetical protein
VINFYTKDEFESQMIKLMLVEGMTELEAYREVQAREIEEKHAYDEWLYRTSLEEDEEFA